MPELSPSDETEPTPTPDDEKTSVRDNWWWSPAFAIVAGVVVVIFQYGPISQSGGVWLNWVVAGVGIALAGYGAVRLVRSYPR
jgi:hypothetical protein